jgi:hypothetical protein
MPDYLDLNGGKIQPLIKKFSTSSLLLLFQFEKKEK